MNKYDKYLKILLGILLITFLGCIIFLWCNTNLVPSISYKPKNNYKETITVIADNDYAPYSYIDKKGKPQGFDIELLYMLADEINVNIDLRLIPWSMDLESITTSDIDLVLGLEYSNDVEDIVDLSHPIQLNEYVAFGKESFYYTSYLNTKKIGILEGSIVYDLYIVPNQLQENTIIFNTYEEGFNAILNNDIDYLIGKHTLGKRLLDIDNINNIKPIGRILTSNTFSIGVNNNSELLYKLNTAIDNLNTNGNIETLTNKWLGHYIRFTSITDIFNVYNIQIIILLGLLLIIFGIIFIKRNEEKKLIEHERIASNNMRIQLEIDPITKGNTYYKFKSLVNEILINDKLNKYVIIVADINGFKYINELYGYDIGNKVLKIISVYFDDYFKSNGIIARTHSDNFVIFTKIKADYKIEDINAYILPKINDLLGDNFRLLFSVGMYLCKDDESIDYMADCAAFAKNEVKGNSLNALSLYTEKMKEKKLFNNNVISMMETSLLNNEFYMIYQPKYCLKTNKLIGSEALVRWKTKDGQDLSPNQFIMIFEKNGFIVKLDYYVMEKVCKFIASTNIKLPVISVNLSGRTLLNNDLVKDYCNIVNKYNLSTNQIEIEITEGVFIDNHDLIKERLKEFKDAGFTISMDDFGSGVSSLNRLQNIDVDIIKLDKVFIEKTINNEKGHTIVKNIVNMCKELNIKTVAEGIENKLQLDKLKSINCDIGQGYYFSKALTEHEFKLLVTK